jgi:hypothetical protein
MVVVAIDAPMEREEANERFDQGRFRSSLFAATS